MRVIFLRVRDICTFLFYTRQSLQGLLMVMVMVMVSVRGPGLPTLAPPITTVPASHHIWGRGARLYLGACAQCKSITRLLPAPILLVARARAVGGGIRHYAVARTVFLLHPHFASSSFARRSIARTPVSLIRISLFSPPCSPSRRSTVSGVSSLFRLSRRCRGK